MASFRQQETETLIHALQSGRLEVLETLYTSHREAFFSFARRRFKANRQDFEDSWQEAVIAFYEQIQSGRILYLQCSVRTWLFAVGCKRLLSYRRKMKRIFWKDSMYAIDHLLQQVEQIESIPEEWSEQEQTLVDQCLEKLSPQCRDLLIRRFYEGLKIPDIRSTLGYNSENSTSAALSRCLRRLKEVVVHFNNTKPSQIEHER